MAAVNPRGVDGARSAAVMMQSQYADAQYLFNLDDQCDNMISNIQLVTYEYYAFGQNLEKLEDLTFKNVRADGTLPNTALVMVRDSVKAISSRPSSLITFTDGEFHHDVSGIVGKLKQLSDVHVLIGAGIGTDTNENVLLQVASNSSTIAYVADRNNVIGFGKEIIRIMKDTAALCESQGIQS